MTPDLGLAGMVFAGIVVAFLVMVLLVIGFVLFTFLRVAKGIEDPAVTELKRRLAAGEISPVEYEVRLRALTGKD